MRRLTDNERVESTRRKRAYRKRWAEVNVESVRAARAAYRQRNREKIRLDNIAYRASFPDRTREATRKWRNRNLDRAREITRAWSVLNVERLQQMRLAWVRANPIREAARGPRHRADLLKRVPIWADFDAIGAVYADRDRLTLTTGIRHDVDHIIPLRSRTVSGLHVHQNLQPMPSLDNQRKSNSFKPEDFQ